MSMIRGQMHFYFHKFLRNARTLKNGKNYITLMDFQLSGDIYVRFSDCVLSISIYYAYQIRQYVLSCTFFLVCDDTKNNPLR